MKHDAWLTRVAAEGAAAGDSPLTCRPRSGITRGMRYIAVARGERNVFLGESLAEVVELTRKACPDKGPDDVEVFMRNGGATYAEKMSPDAYSEVPRRRAWKLRETEGGVLVAVIGRRAITYQSGNLLMLGEPHDETRGPLVRSHVPDEVVLYREEDGFLNEVLEDEYSVAEELGGPRAWKELTK